jgi:hypothetical protein
MLHGEPTLRLPYAEPHAPLEETTIDGPPSVVEVVGSFEDGPALWAAIVERGMEGVVAKRECEPPTDTAGRPARAAAAATNTETRAGSHSSGLPELAVLVRPRASDHHDADS